MRLAALLAAAVWAASLVPAPVADAGETGGGPGVVDAPSRADRTVRTGVITADGAWSWFSDPRAMYVDGRLVACWVRSDGVLQFGEWIQSYGRSAVSDLEYGFPPDDHNCPALIRTSDGRLTVFFAGHAETSQPVMSRTTAIPGDFSRWLEPRPIPTNTRGGGGVTYANPLPVPGFTDRAYVMWRGGNWKPTFSIGEYDPERAGWEWSDAHTLVAASGGRPYARYRPFRSESIGVAFTNGHPRDKDNNVYFALIKPDSRGWPVAYHSDGSREREVPGAVTSTVTADVVYDRVAEGGDDSWVWDVAFKADGTPVVAYATFTSRTSHMYHWACYSDSAWVSHVLLDDAGASIADTTIHYPQYYYSGGIALDPNDPCVVYLSRRNDVGGWDIEQWTTRDDGESWTSVPITSNEMVDNVRPFVPWGCPEGTHIVMWMSGRYDFYKSHRKASLAQYAGLRRFETAIRFWWESDSD